MWRTTARLEWLSIVTNYITTDFRKNNRILKLEKGTVLFNENRPFFVDGDSTRQLRIFL